MKILDQILAAFHAKRDILELDGQNLTELPPEIGMLTELQVLSLSNNQLTRLPAEIGNLSKLVELALDQNCLAELPAQIGQLASLEILLLSNNKLRKLPSAIGKLTKLRTLYIQENCLSELPAEIGKLTKLRRLYIQENCLSELPAEFAWIESLQEVNLDEWQLKHPNCIPRMIRNFMAYGNPWVYPPAEIMNQNVEVIRDYLKANPNPRLVDSAKQPHLPFVVGVLADFSGQADKPTLNSRQFVEVNRANFDLTRDELEKCRISTEHCSNESSWRGLKYLVDSTDSQNVKIRLLDVSKEELYRDMQRAVDFDHSTLFKKVHDDIFGTADVEPFGILIGDYEFSNDRADLDLLDKISLIAEAIHAPFLSAAAPQLLGVKNFAELAVNKDFHSLFKGAESTRWVTFRQSEAARYVCLTVPRLLLSFETLPLWGNAAFGLGARVISAFAQWAWCANIRGRDGGSVTGLPKWTFAAQSTSAEVVLDLWQQKALADSGFVAFGHHHGPSDGFAFVGTCHQPATYESAESTMAARLASDLRYVLSISRLVHFLRAMIRDQQPGIILEAGLKEKLNEWMGQYISTDGNLSAAQPLTAAHIDVSPPAGNSGFATVSVRASPGFQLEILPYSMHAIFRLPPFPR